MDNEGSLKRKINEMPDFVREELEKHSLMDRYLTRPPYQRNDYLGWIIRAARQETKDKRLAQMVYELEKGDVYMGMDWKKGRNE
ncbi:MAG: YdeI/OmpD-associated family protein [Youngiibacter sp.]|nr:YdeI/OmpD-associated family protein [Youngiibacter sp.]